MVAYQLNIVKRGRNAPLADIPISFPPLENLHLELMENKKKLKPGLPLVPIVKRAAPVEKAKAPSSPPPLAPSPVSSPAPAPSPDTKRRRATRTSKPPPPSPPPTEEDEDEELMAALADEDEAIEVEEEAKEKPAADEEEEREEEVKPEEDDPYAGLSPEERIEKEREEYIWRFRILKKQYKNKSIPDYNEHSDLQMMKRDYDRTVKELYLDDSVESYRAYMMGSFLFIEFAATQWIGIDLGGFTMQQARMMHKYDRLLIELGEKSYTQWGASLPVELRLTFIVLLNAGIFYLGKIVASKFGSTVGELFKAFTGQPPEAAPAAPAAGAAEPSKRKMRGPKIRVDDIKKDD